MVNIRIQVKDKIKRLAKSMLVFVRSKYKALLYYGAMAVVLVLLAAAAESYRTDSEDAQPLVLTENMVQEAVADAGQEIIRPDGMELARGFSKQTEWNSVLKQWEMHCANDYIFEDDRIVCLMSGTVSDFGQSAGEGGFIEIQGDDGRLYRYCSIMPDEAILIGDEITAGAIIGLASEGMPSEISQGNHVHLEVYEAGELCDFESLCVKNVPSAD